MPNQFTWLALVATLLACRNTSSDGVMPEPPPEPPIVASEPIVAVDIRPPNELGRIPVLEYHVVGGPDALFTRSAANFRRDLELVYARGYRPISISDLVDGRIDLPAGLSPVVFTFDDASPGQFRYLERDGKRVLDDTSALGIWRALQRKHPDWRSSATFCLLSGASAGHAFFGDKDIQGQRSAWRLEKVRTLAESGFELCGHTLWHARLDRYPDAGVQEHIARGVLAIDSAVPGYRVRTFSLPLGKWPSRQDLAWKGGWRDPRTGRETRYEFDAVLLVAGGAARSPHDPEFDAKRIPRTIVTKNALVELLDRLEARGERYVSDGDPQAVARPISAVVTPETAGVTRRPTPAVAAPSKERSGIGTAAPGDKR